MLTLETGGTRAAAGCADQHRGSEVTILSVLCSGTQLTFHSNLWLLTIITCGVAVAILDGGGWLGSISGHKADGWRRVAEDTNKRGQADTIQAAGAYAARCLLGLLLQAGWGMPA